MEKKLTEDDIKICRNRIKCKHCGDEIQSDHIYDFKFCKCGKVAVDGGKYYLRRIGNREDYIELSLFEDVEHVEGE